MHPYFQNAPTLTLQTSLIPVMSGIRKKDGTPVPVSLVEAESRHQMFEGRDEPHLIAKHDREVHVGELVPILLSQFIQIQQNSGDLDCWPVV